ncbi:MAG: galactosyldiacylglycerol synthase, partial [Candidatus Omnitrophica bacterium]|nr:galactosyldiacylglycerol synthase [Candidatus Omnitrophota bacterium]
IVKPLPGQEANNTNYLLEKKAAVMADDLIKINLVIDGLLGEPERLKQLSESSASISKPDSSFDIAKLILNL